MKNVWVIEQGCYSDYSVVGVFGNEENARRICEKLNAVDHSDEASVACWPLDPCIAELNAGRQMYSIQMDYDGTVKRCDVAEFSSYHIGYDMNPKVWQRTEAPHWKGRPITDMVTGTVWAKSDKHAIKIANEFRAQAIADGRMSRRD